MQFKNAYLIIKTVLVNKNPASHTMGIGVFPVKLQGSGIKHPPSSRADVKEREELYRYSFSVPFMAGYRTNFAFLINSDTFWLTVFLMKHYMFRPFKVTWSANKRLRWSRGSMLAFGTQVRGFEPDRSRRIFHGEKIHSTPSFGGEVKPSVPCRRFTAFKRSLNFTWKSGIFSQNSSAISRPCSSTFRC